MGRFGKMIGLLEFNINGEEITIKPLLGDNSRLMKIMTEKDESLRLDKLMAFFVDLMKRTYPEEPIDEIKLFVEFNFIDFLKEILIGFKYMTREEWEQNQGDVKKKLMSGDSLQNREDSE